MDGNYFINHQYIQDLMQALKKVQEFGPKYSTKNVIGSGAYGDVYQAKNVLTGEKVAIKKLKNIFQNKFIALRALRQVTLLRVINSPKIIKIHEIIPPADPTKFDTLGIVLEYFPNDLSKIYSKNITLQDQNIQYIIYQILVAFKYLKSAKILHRDLKPQNILLDKNFSVKLCDFGLARSIVAYEQPKLIDKTILENLKEESEHIKKAEKLSIHVVTRWYRAPELILLQSQYDISIQMWSIACILAQLIGIHKKNKVSTFSYKPLFEGKACFPLSPPKNEVIESYKNEDGFAHSELDQLTKILEIIGTPEEQDLQNIKDKYALAYIKSFSKRPRKSFKSLFNYSKPEWIDFLQKTLVFNPSKRLTINEALQHPIFQKVRNKEIEMETNEVFLNMNLHSGLTIEEIKERFLQQIKYHQNKGMQQQK